MKELTVVELCKCYLEWLDTKKIKVYCSDYPVFLSEIFPEGIKIVGEEGE